MSDDARFEDGDERPLRLMAFDAEDLQVISALVQDAVLSGADIVWHPHDRQLALLLNRFRWEDADRALKRARPVERVRTLLVIGNARAVRAQGVPKGDAETVLSLLSIGFDEAEAPSGRLSLTFAGDGAIEVDVEALELSLKDVTRPYRAPSGHLPHHD